MIGTFSLFYNLEKIEVLKLDLSNNNLWYDLNNYKSLAENLL